MTYKPTEWVNAVYDDEGNILRKGTPLTAENMNNIENKLLQLDEDNHVHINKEVLDVITESLIDMIHEHLNKEILDQITQEHLDNSHKHGNKALIDTIVRENVHKHGNKEVLDKVTQSLLDKEHNHNNKQALDTITQSLLNMIHEHLNREVIDQITQTHLDNSHKHLNRGLIDSIDKDNVHKHGNKEVLDKVTQNFLDKEHSHTNKGVIDKITQKHLDDIGNHSLQLFDHEERIVNLVQSLSNLKIKVVSNIAERNALDNKDSIVHVIDASADTTVDSGWAQYLYQDGVWVKIAEKESLDVILNWADIVGKPTEYNPKAHSHTIANIQNLQATLDSKETPGGAQSKADTVKELLNTHSKNNTHITDTERTSWNSAVTEKHTHSNKGVLDKVNQDLLDKKHSHSNKSVLDTVTQEHLNNIAEALVRIKSLEDESTHLHTHVNKSVIDKLTQGHLDDTHTHGNKLVLDKLTQAVIDNTHKHLNRVVIDKLTQEHLDNIAEALVRIKSLEDRSTQLHTHINKEVIDKLTQGHLDDRHKHSNKAVLDKVTQGVIDSTHNHTNKAVLDSITQTLLDKIHEHKNKGTLDKMTYTGVKETIDLVLLDELENHTHDYSEIENTPSIPSRISHLEDDSEFVKSNVERITVSTAAPTNPKTNDIWIVI